MRCSLEHKTRKSLHFIENTEWSDSSVAVCMRQPRKKLIYDTKVQVHYQPEIQCPQRADSDQGRAKSSTAFWHQTVRTAKQLGIQ